MTEAVSDLLVLDFVSFLFSDIFFLADNLYDIPSDASRIGDIFNMSRLQPL